MVARVLDFFSQELGQSFDVGVFREPGFLSTRPHRVCLFLTMPPAVNVLVEEGEGLVDGAIDKGLIAVLQPAQAARFRIGVLVE